jgi:hypothetical protein
MKPRLRIARPRLAIAIATAALAFASSGTVPAAAAARAVIKVASPAPRIRGFRLATGVRLPGTHLPHVTPSAVTLSTNWAGHAIVADSGIHLRYIAADFTIPSVDCAKSTLGTSGFAYVSDWAGLDGFNSNTVEQTGVDGFCNSSRVPQYFAWYEMFPLAPVAFSGVSPGDAITVSVFFNGSNYNLVLTDVTTGGFINVTQNCPSGSVCRNSSAEVITEDPGNSVPSIDLADFGMVNFTGAAVTTTTGVHGTLAASTRWTASQVVMEDPSSNVIANPSGLYGGQAFNVTWLHGGS